MTSMTNRDNKLVERLDSVSIAVGSFAAWLTFLMVLVTFVIVIMRYAFDLGFIWLQESLTWLHATVFMLGAAYTLQQDEHVRVDIFYREMTRLRRAVINALGVIVFVFPLCAFMAIESWDYVRASWSIKEISRDAGGLPYPAIPLLKSTLLLMPVAVSLQGLSLLLRSIGQIRRA